MFGGYSRFSGERLEGPNGSLLFVPGLRFGDNFSLLPVFTADYQKARDVQELAGGGFLTVAQTSRGFSLRGIQEVGPLKLKAYGAYKQNFLKEATDEPWGDGLFDYNKTAFGLEAEGRTPVLFESLRAGVDYYSTVFPNFRSLASGQTGAEINTGSKVLDFNAVDVPLAADLSLGRQRLELRALTSFRDFSDQNVIQDDGSFSNKKRRDLYWNLSAGVTRVLPKASFFGSLESAATLSVAHGVLDSNQNSYDVAATEPRANYYSYAETSVGPRWQFRWREWMTGSLSYLYARRDYTDRAAQGLDGMDTGEAITTDTQTFRWTFSFPLVQGFSLELRGALQHADSNMKNESVYRYNYTSSNHFLGVAWQL